MPTTEKKKFKIGANVTVRLGTTKWRARIVENRGQIGVNGRSLFRVQLLDNDEENPQFVEVPTDDIQVGGH